MFTTILGVLSFVVTTAAAILAAIQTMRLRTAKRMINTHARSILLESRDLASHLFNEANGNIHMLQCGEKAQLIQKAMWLLVVNMSNVTEEEVDEKWKQKKIGEYEYRWLKDFTKRI